MTSYSFDEKDQAGLEVNVKPDAWKRMTKRYSGKQYEEVPHRTIFGLSVGTFWAVLVVLCVFIAGGIGGGIGVGLASQKKKCPR